MYMHVLHISHGVGVYPRDVQEEDQENYCAVRWDTPVAVQIH